MKPSIPKGTRDFSAEEVAKRNFIMNTIKSSFENFGFAPIETPSFENSETLMGKYGDEGDRLIFKILNSGDYYEDVKQRLTNVNSFRNEIRNTVETNYKIIVDFFIRNKIRKSDLVDHRQQLENSLNFAISREKSFFKFNVLNKYFEKNIDRIIKHLVLIDTDLSKVKSPNEHLRRRLDKLTSSIYEETIEDYVKDNLSNFGERIFSSTHKDFSSIISEKALRYDLTVPFARYVVQHQNEITFPFKRYQIQPVWRADRPQKGRFREFFQCDADVVGSKSLWQEVEFIQLYDDVFNKLKLNGTTIKINNRKILSGIAEVIGASDKLIDFTVALDKLDKIGKEGVVKEMLAKGIAEDAIKKVNPLFEFSGDNQQKLESLENLLSTSEEGTKGVNELRFVINSISEIGLQTATLEVDVTLARGLNYYTGAIFEVSAPKEVKLGSIGGGGRYDDLTGIFGMPDVSGVGISFGLDRIYLVLEELNLFESVALSKPKILFVNFGKKEALFCVKAMTKLRQSNIKCELYPDDAKMKKQMNYANKREIPFVVIVGSREMEENVYNLKNMISGEQVACSLEELIKKLNS